MVFFFHPFGLPSPGGPSGAVAVPLNMGLVRLATSGLKENSAVPKAEGDMGVSNIPFGPKSPQVASPISWDMSSSCFATNGVIRRLKNLGFEFPASRRKFTNPEKAVAHAVALDGALHNCSASTNLQTEKCFF